MLLLFLFLVSKHTGGLSGGVFGFASHLMEIVNVAWCNDGRTVKHANHPTAVAYKNMTAREKARVVASYKKIVEMCTSAPAEVCF